MCFTHDLYTTCILRKILKSYSKAVLLFSCILYRKNFLGVLKKH